MDIPKHIAVIMDGNGRWARKRGLARIFGHKKGIDNIKTIVNEAKKLGVKVFTVFAFSTENWDRPKKEVGFLFKNLDSFLDTYKKELINQDIKLNVIGRRDRINSQIIKKIEEVEKITENNKSFIFNIALDYGGRWDIVNAIKKILTDYKHKKISPEDITETSFAEYLSLGGIASPDLLIRTSGEQRLSNFLIWDLAYSEFYFVPEFWPDFNKSELEKAIKTYSQRQRRFGRVHE